MGPRGGDELNLIEPGRNYGWPLVSEGEQLRRRADPRPFDAAASSSRPSSPGTRRSRPTSLLIYTGDLFPAVEGRALDRRAVGPGADPRRHSTATRRARPTNGTWAQRIRCGRAGARRRGLSARGRRRRAAAEADAGSGAAVAQVIRPAALAPGLGAVAGLDPAAGRLEEVLGPLRPAIRTGVRGAA